MVANRTTSVSADKTVNEIQQMLAGAKAASTMIDYVDGKPEAIAFRLISHEQEIAFRLPSNWRGIIAAMRKDRKIPNRLINEEQARRVAWRVVRDWLRAQLTMIEAGHASLEEVMLPWAITNDGQTVAQKMYGPNGYLRIDQKK